MRILIINGPNINLLGFREPEIYGTATYADLISMVEACAQTLGVDVSFFQSNSEGEIVDVIQQARGDFEGIIINPAAYTHTSIAIPDALAAVNIPAVEVHISDPDTREEYRRISYVRDICVDTVKGEGISGYVHALEILKDHLGLAENSADH